MPRISLHLLCICVLCVGAQSARPSGFELFLASDGCPWPLFDTMPLADIPLQDTPLLTVNDIDSYRVEPRARDSSGGVDVHVMIISDSARNRLGMPRERAWYAGHRFNGGMFVVVVDGDRVYRGSFCQPLYYSGGTHASAWSMYWCLDNSTT